MASAIAVSSTLRPSVESLYENVLVVLSKLLSSELLALRFHFFAMFCTSEAISASMLSASSK